MDDEMERWHTVLEQGDLILDEESEKRIANRMNKNLKTIKNIDWGKAQKELLWDMTPDEAYSYMGERGPEYHDKLAKVALNEKSDLENL